MIRQDGHVGGKGWFDLVYRKRLEPCAPNGTEQKLKIRAKILSSLIPSAVLWPLREGISMSEKRGSAVHEVYQAGIFGSRPVISS